LKSLGKACVRGHAGSGQHRQDELLRSRNRRADIRLTAGSESRIRRKTDKVGPVRGQANLKATSSEEEGDEDSDRLRFDNGNSTGAALAQDVTAGEASFRKCQLCHDVGEEARNKLGPELNGLNGRKSGAVENFNYSEGLKNSGITWSEETFKEFIKDPRGKVPSTTMLFPGIKDERELGDLFAYLNEFGPDRKKK
jgi:cytochrome c